MNLLLWENLIVDWVKCLPLNGMSSKKCFKEIKRYDLDQVAKYVLIKEGFQNYSPDKKDWAVQLFSDKFPSLGQVCSLSLNTEELIVAWAAVIVYCCLKLKDKDLLFKMCSMQSDHQIHLTSLFSSFVNMNLSLISYSHFLEILSLISGDNKSDSVPLSSPLSYSNFIRSAHSTPTSTSVRDLQEKFEEFNHLKQKIAQHEFEKDDLLGIIKELKTVLSARDKEISHQRDQITTLNKDIEILKDSCDPNNEEVNLFSLKQRYLHQIQQLKMSHEEEVSKVSVLEDQLKEIKEKIFSIQNEKLELKNKCYDLECSNSELEAKVVEMTVTIDELIKRNQELDSLSNQNDARDMSNYSFHSEDFSFSSINCSSSNNIGNFLLLETQNQLEEVKREYEMKETAYCELVDKLRINEQLLADKNLVVDNLTAKMLVLQDKLHATDKFLEVGEKRISSLINEFNALYLEKKTLRDSLESLRQCHSEYELLCEKMLHEASIIKNQFSLCLDQLNASRGKIVEDENIAESTVAEKLGSKICFLKEGVASLKHIVPHVKSIEEKLETLEADMQAKESLFVLEEQKVLHLEKKLEDLKSQEFERMQSYKSFLKSRYNEEIRQREETYISAIKKLQQTVSQLKKQKGNTSSVPVKPTFIKPQDKPSRVETRKESRRVEDVSVSQLKQQKGNNTVPVKLNFIKPQDKPSCVETRKESRRVEDVSNHSKSQMKNSQSETACKEEEFSEHHRQALLQKRINFDDDKRLDELKARNSLLPPHLQTSYPGETQMLSPSKFKESDFKTWCSKKSSGFGSGVGLRQRSYNDLHRTSDIFAPLERSRSQELDHAARKVKGS